MGFFRQVQQGFSSFFAKFFGIFGDFANFCSASTFKNHQLGQKYGLKCRKNPAQLDLKTHFSMAFPKPGFSGTPCITNYYNYYLCQLLGKHTYYHHKNVIFAIIKLYNYTIDEKKIARGNLCFTNFT